MNHQWQSYTTEYQWNTYIISVIYAGKLREQDDTNI